MISKVRPHISRFDKAFKEDYSRNYHLTIRIAADGFSLVVFSPEKNRFLALEHYRFPDINDDIKLAAAIDEIAVFRQWIAYPFHAVTAIVDHAWNTLIPLPLFEEKEKGTYLAFNQQYRDNSRILSDQLPTAEAVNIYYLSNPVVEKIKDLWANANILHQTSVLLESILINHRNISNENKVFVHVGKNCFDLVWIKKEKLGFYNRFRFNTPEDFIYFILFTFDQLGVNPESAEIVFSGQIERSMPYYDITWKYVRNISFAARNNSFDYSYILEEIAFHQHIILYNALQCEL